MAAKMSTILRNQSGAALVIALIMMVVITLIALASSYTSIFEIKISGNKRGSTDAFYAADAGINILTSNPTYSFNPTSYPAITAPNTLSTYSNPFGNLPSPFNNLPNQNVPISVTGWIKNVSNESGPPRGGGYSAVNVSYAYFQVQCTGIDSAVNGVIGVSGAQATVQEDVMQIIPIAQ
jgi:hypothetical protein